VHLPSEYDDVFYNNRANTHIYQWAYTVVTIKGTTETLERKIQDRKMQEQNCRNEKCWKN